MPNRSDETDNQRGEVPLDSRPYVHESCGQVTVVSGDDFSRLANPFAVVTGTYCVSCQAMVNLGTVSWADTQEPISKYRRRLRAEAPLSLKLFGWVIGPLGSAALGAGIGWLFTPNQSKGPIIGGVMAFLLTIGFLMPVLASLVWGIDYRRVK
jgi:hypothetical protein